MFVSTEIRGISFMANFDILKELTDLLSFFRSGFVLHVF